ncbi:hypothetical protein DL93DRAFT_371795 [Clavulina sp. PMI_390]|nr:hypothetical protein DL93DRAFT_371795 [Clavulina sp. PMI_390]
MLFPKVDLTPVLLATTPGGRAARVAHLTQTIEKLTVLITPYDHSLESNGFARSIQRLKVLRARCIFSLSPISAIPEEILLHIFDWVAPINGGMDQILWRWSLDLSHTCSRWRSITLAYAKLWCKLTVCSPKQTPLIPLFCKRSRHIRCKLFITSYPRGVATDIPPRSIKVTPSCAPQVSEIGFRGAGAFAALRIDYKAASLLRLDCIRATDVPFRQNNFPLYLLQATNLELISSSFDEGLFGITFDRLCHFSLAAQPDGKAVLALFNTHMPVLDTLTITGAVDSTAFRAKTFTSLRRLELRETYSGLHRAIGRVLLFPKLQHLSIEKLFSYSDWGLSNQGLPNMIARCSSIKTLHLHAPNADDLVRMLAGLESPDAAPLLCRLKLTLAPLRPSIHGFNRVNESQAPTKLREKLRARVVGTRSIPPLSTLIMSGRAAGEHVSWYAAEAQHFELVDPLILEEM